jgi:hypothetical protein
VQSCSPLIDLAQSHFNPNSDGWGCIWHPKLWTGLTPHCLKYLRILNLCVPQKNISKVYLIKYLWKENGIFGNFYVNNFRQRPVFGAIFVYFENHGGLLPPLTPSTTTPCLGNPRRCRLRLQHNVKPPSLPLVALRVKYDTQPNSYALIFTAIWIRVKPLVPPPARQQTLQYIFYGVTHTSANCVIQSCKKAGVNKFCGPYI